MEKPSWIKCVQRTQKETWCGERFSSHEWTFRDEAHARNCIKLNTRTQPCGECMKVLNTNS
jgi:hypothetical protein